MKLKRYPKEVLRKHYARQVVMPQVLALDEPHKIVRCAVCDEAKKLEFHRNGDGELYYKCDCGFESEPLGLFPYSRQESEIISNSIKKVDIR